MSTPNFRGLAPFFVPLVDFRSYPSTFVEPCDAAERDPFARRALGQAIQRVASPFIN
jgi:hypothetical protein